MRIEKQYFVGDIATNNGIYRCDTFTVAQAREFIQSGCAGAAKQPSAASTSANWLGMTYSKAKALSGYPSALDSISRIAASIAASEQISAPRSIKRTRVYVGLDCDGELDIDRYRAGSDTPLATRKRTPRHSVGKIIHLTCNFGGTCNYSAEQLQYAGATLCALAQLLEQAGYRCEITGLNSSVGVYTSGHARHSLLCVPIKDANDPLDISTLAYVTANPAFFRLVMFRRLLPHMLRGNRFCFSMGSTRPTPVQFQGDIHIQETWSLEQAINAARRALTSLEA